MKNVKMFSDGTFVTASDKGPRKATIEEVSEFLASQFPKKKAGGELTHVKYESDTGYAKARYSNNKIFRKKIAQIAPITEPDNSVDFAEPDPKVPRDKNKSKPEIDVGRSDVDNPTEVRKKEYNRGGQGGQDNHSDVIPMSNKDSGLSGSEETTFAEEEGNNATSDDPDNYVQKLNKPEKPTPAGQEMNHATVKIKQASELYTKLDLTNGKENEDLNKKTAAPKKENDKEKNEKPEAYKGDEGEEINNREAESKLKKDLKTAMEQVQQIRNEADETIDQLKKEIAIRKIHEARQKAATGLVLRLRDRSPQKYATAEAFNERVDSLAKKMSVEAIETAIEEIDAIRSQESERAQEMEEAAKSKPEIKAEGGLSTAIVMPKTDSDESEDLTELIMSNTKLGKSVAKMDAYHQERGY